MNHFLFPLGFIIVSLHGVVGFQCHFECPVEDDMVCGFDPNGLAFNMFPSKCAMKAYVICTQTVYEAVPLKYCVKKHVKMTRRMYGESCPVFCPEYYRPVCGASKYRDYLYRTFINGCYLDMINCRGDDDYTGYVEVPLHYCQRHLMKNIFKERLVVSNMYDVREYANDRIV